MKKILYSRTVAKKQVIDLYFPLWSTVNLSTQRTIDAHKNRLTGEFEVAEVEDFDRKGKRVA